ncbi:MAG: riboflavin synthase [Alistipes sp.]
MFTGIIEEVGSIRSLRRHSRGVTLEVAANTVLEGTQIGDSIATNGVCLTVTGQNRGWFAADVMAETIACSTLGTLRSGDRVNLERALCLNGRLGGHLVAGHVDGTGRITALEQDGIALWLTITAVPEILRYIVKKGSIAIDGVSLTVASVEAETFRVSLIPHTQAETTLLDLRVGQTVNLENDLLVKYVEKLMGAAARPGISLDFLHENGF